MHCVISNKIQLKSAGPFEQVSGDFQKRTKKYISLELELKKYILFVPPLFKLNASILAYRMPIVWQFKRHFLAFSMPNFLMFYAKQIGI